MKILWIFFYLFIYLFFFFWGGGHDKIGQNENILAWQKFEIFFARYFLRQTVDAGPNPTYEEKVRVPPPPPPPHTHTHTHPGSQSMMRSC